MLTIAGGILIAVASVFALGVVCLGVMFLQGLNRSIKR